MSYPLALIRTRLQAQGSGGRPVLYTGTVDCARAIYTAHGVRGLYAGIGPNMLKAVPAISIGYVVSIPPVPFPLPFVSLCSNRATVLVCGCVNLRDATLLSASQSRVDGVDGWTVGRVPPCGWAGRCKRARVGVCKCARVGRTIRTAISSRDGVVCR